MYMFTLVRCCPFERCVYSFFHVLAPSNWGRLFHQINTIVFQAHIPLSVRPCGAQLNADASFVARKRRLQGPFLIVYLRANREARNL